jgi:hypothetical protein
VTVTDPPSGAEAPAPSCRECEEIDLAEAVARAEHDASGETDCRVLRRRHQRTGHEGQP